MTPWRPGNWGVANPHCWGCWDVENLRCPRHQGFEIHRCHGYQGVAFVPDNRESRIASIWDTRDFWLPCYPGHRGVANPQCPEHMWVFFLTVYFFQTSSNYYSHQNNNQSKSSVSLLFKIQIHLVHVLNIFLTSLFLIVSPVSRMVGSCFKTVKTLWKIIINKMAQANF